jgi:hypothetical protein
MTPVAKKASITGGVAVAVGTVIALFAHKTTMPVPPPTPGPYVTTAIIYNYCTDAVYYTRSCETSPMSVAAGTPGYAGQICGAHTWSWRGDDLFTYAYMDQGGARSYARPPASAGATALAKWDDCFVNHNPAALATGYPCATAIAPGGVQQYHPLTFAQLPPGPQKIAWGTKYGCSVGTPIPVTTTPGALICMTVTPATVCVTVTP